MTNPLGLGFDAMAMVGVRTSGPPEEVADAIAQLDEADYVVVAAGQFDLLVELVCVDRRHLLDVTNRIRALDGVASTETFVYLELHKQLYDWGIRQATTSRLRRQARKEADGNRTSSPTRHRRAPRRAARQGPEGRRARLHVERRHRRRLDGARRTASRRRSASSP